MPSSGPSTKRPTMVLLARKSVLRKAGNSVSAAIQRLKDKGAKDIKLVCLLSAPEGIKHVNADHPDVQIFTAAVDRKLNSHGYIVPGLGDAGDRMFGTK